MDTLANQNVTETKTYVGMSEAGSQPPWSVKPFVFGALAALALLVFCLGNISWPQS